MSNEVTLDDFKKKKDNVVTLDDFKKEEVKLEDFQEQPKVKPARVATFYQPTTDQPLGLSPYMQNVAQALPREVREMQDIPVQALDWLERTYAEQKITPPKPSVTQRFMKGEATREEWFAETKKAQQKVNALLKEIGAEWWKGIRHPIKKFEKQPIATVWDWAIFLGLTRSAIQVIGRKLAQRQSIKLGKRVTAEEALRTEMKGAKKELEKVGIEDIPDEVKAQLPRDVIPEKIKIGKPKVEPKPTPKVEREPKIAIAKRDPNIQWEIDRIEGEYVYTKSTGIASGGKYFKDNYSKPQKIPRENISEITTPSKLAKKELDYKRLEDAKVVAKKKVEEIEVSKQAERLKETKKHKKPISDKYYVLEAKKDAWIEMQGKKVEVPGFEEYDFFVHKSLPGSRYAWNITEAKTGMYGWGARTRKETIERIKEHLPQLGKKKLNEAMEYGLKKYGISPRYKAITRPKYQKPTVTKTEPLKAKASQYVAPKYPRRATGGKFGDDIRKGVQEADMASMVESEGMLKKIGVALGNTFQYERILKKFPKLQNEFRLHQHRIRQIPETAHKRTHKLVKPIIDRKGKFDPDAWNAFRNAWFARDMKWRESVGKEVPWDKAEIQRFFVESEKQLAKYPDVKKALQDIHANFMEYAKAHGIEKPNPFYAPHQVIEYNLPEISEWKAGTAMQRLKRYKPGHFLQAKGTAKMHETNPIVFLNRFFVRDEFWKHQMNLIDHIVKNYDAKELVFKAFNAKKMKELSALKTKAGKPRKIAIKQLPYQNLKSLPNVVEVGGKRYVKLNFEQLFAPKRRHIQWAAESPAEWAIKTLEDFGHLNIEFEASLSKALKRKFAKGFGAKYKTVFLPEDIYRRVVDYRLSFVGTHWDLMRGAMKMTNFWKWFVLTAAGVPFHIRNFLGDMENAIRYTDIKVLGKYPRAFKEAFGSEFKQGWKASPEWQRAFNHAVTESGWSATEIRRPTDIFKRPEYKQLFYNYGGKKWEYHASRIPQVMRKFANARENSGRYAAFLRAAEKYKAPDWVIGKGVREALVDYGKFTPAETALMRGFLFPFYAFYKQNFANWAKSIGQRTGWYGGKLVAPLIAAEVWNQAFFPEMEATHSEWVKGTWHLNTPFKMPDGKPIVLIIPWASQVMLQQTGFIDLKSAIIDRIKGNITADELKDRLIEKYGIDIDRPEQNFLIETVVELTNPYVKVPSELYAGRKAYSGGKIVKEAIKDTPAGRAEWVMWLISATVPASFPALKGMRPTGETWTEYALESPVGIGITKGMLPTEEAAHRQLDSRYIALRKARKRLASLKLDKNERARLEKLGKLEETEKVHQKNIREAQKNLNAYQKRLREMGIRVLTEKEMEQRTRERYKLE